MNTVCGAPMIFAELPANKLPKGTVPIKAIVKKLMTRPLTLSSTMDCSIVLLEAICNIIPSPVITIKTKESVKKCE